MKKTLALAAVLTASVVSSYSAAQTSRVLSVEQVTVASTKPPVQAFAITATMSQPDGIYNVGEQVHMTVRLDKSAYLLVVNVDETGQVAQLFPNEFNKDNFIEGGKDLVLPGPGARIVAAGPAGTELVKIIATEKPLTLDDITLTAPAGPFLVAPAGSGTNLSRTLGAVKLDTNTNPTTGGGNETPPAGSPQTPPAEDTPVADEAPDFGAWGEMTLLLTTVEKQSSVVVPDATKPTPATSNARASSDN